MALTLIDGKNFSGRTDQMSACIARDDDGPTALVGPSPARSLSGVATTAVGEMAWYGGYDWRVALEHIRANRWWSMSSLSSRLTAHPLTLSGGEQALLAIASAIVGDAKRLGIDVALEQVDEAIRERLLQWLDESSIEAWLVDHRLGAAKRRYRTLSPAQSPGFGLRPELTISRFPLRAATSAGEWELRSVHVKYPGSKTDALRAISARLERGVICHLTGANGSGKSTLAKTLTGLLRLRHGTLCYGGVEVNPWRSPSRLAAFHFQDPDAQLFSVSVRQEIASSGCGADAADVEAAFGLTSFAEAHPLDLPFLLRKRLSLAVTFAMRRPWIVLDEPTLGFDDESVAALAQLTLATCAAGTGVLVISHDHRFIEAVSPKLRLRMDRGTLHADETNRDL